MDCTLWSIRIESCAISQSAKARLVTLCCFMINLFFLPETIPSDRLFTEAGDLNRNYFKHSVFYAF